MTRASGAHWLLLFSANWYSFPSSAFYCRSEKISQAHCIHAFVMEPETVQQGRETVRYVRRKAAAFLGNRSRTAGNQEFLK
jgi:hypothetical protein